MRVRLAASRQHALLRIGILWCISDTSGLSSAARVRQRLTTLRCELIGFIVRRAATRVLCAHDLQGGADWDGNDRS